MNISIEKVKENMEIAQTCLNKKMYKQAANAMRQVAEDVAEFYVQYDVSKRICDQVDNEESASHFCMNIYKLRRRMSYTDIKSFRRKVDYFLSLALVYGNEGSHHNGQVESWEAEFLVNYFERSIYPLFMSDCTSVGKYGSIIYDITSSFQDCDIYIYSAAAEKYASSKNGLNRVPVCCDAKGKRKACGNEEIFHVTVDKSGWAFFKASNGLYLYADLEEDRECPLIRAVAEKTSDWGKFKIYRYGKDYLIRAGGNGKWVSCYLQWDDKNLVATVDNADWWEMFRIEKANEK